MKRPVLFLDDGGVLSDNERRAPQWRVHLGAFLSRELGGDPAAWGSANVPAFERSWARWLEAMRARKGLRDAMRDYDLYWLREMASRVGVPLPADDDRVVELTRRTSRYVTERVRAFYPHVVASLRELHRRGHTLHTASGALEADLDGYLRAEGVRELFITLYGTDIVDTWKDGPEYYRMVFAHAGVEARDALVVDDQPSAVAWAREAGAQARWLAREGDAPGDALRSLADLLERLV